MTLPKPLHLRPFLRPFSTTHHHQKPTTHRFPNNRPTPYPYGPALHYKQSDSGLYGGATIQFGNLISAKNEHKSRRCWRPNIHRKRLWSDALGRFVSVKVQARVLRTIDKCGGLDAYLLGDKPGRIKELGVTGWRLRWLVMRTKRVVRKVRAEKQALGMVVTRKGVVKGMRMTRMEPETETETLEDEVERASGEVVEQISQGGGPDADAAGPDGSSEAEAEAEAVQESEEDWIESEAKVDDGAQKQEQKIGMDMEKEAEGGIIAKIRGLFSRR